MDPITALVVSVSAGLIVVSITGAVAYFRGKRKGEEEYEKQCLSHIAQFSQLLDKKIKDAAKAVKLDNREDVIVKAKAIVKVRNDLKEDLDDLRSLLNSTIDELEALVKSNDNAVLNENSNQIRVLVQVLHESWDAKAPQIETRLRSLMAKLGVYPKFNKNKKDKW
jgi:hypothetical protein